MNPVLQRESDALLAEAVEPEDVVLGGGNVKQLNDLPPGCQAGDVSRY